MIGIDKLVELVSSASFAVGIFCDTGKNEFRLVEYGLPNSDFQEDLLRLGHTFVGVLAIVDGCPRSAMTAPLDRGTVEKLSTAFTQMALVGDLGMRTWARYPARTLEGLIALEWSKMIRECEDPRINVEPIQEANTTSSYSSRTT